MCGNHSEDGSPIDHHHGGQQIFYPRAQQRSRRAFLGNVGVGAVACAVFTPTLLAACSSSDDVVSPTTVAQTDPTAVPPTAATASTATAEPVPEQPEQLRWAQTNLGFVSAYVLARGNRAAIVDTGTAGSAAAIGASLQSLGLNYSNVEHVILTHHHPDHAGSIDEVLAEAVNATAWVGEADLDELGGRTLNTVIGGEDVFGFDMLATPGHTAGHMAAYDSVAGLLIAGDALGTDGGGVTELPARFFDDVPQSRESIKKLASFSFNTLLVGHGAPIETGADTALADLAASLG